MQQSPDNGIVILGCGGHARSVAATALSLGVSKIVFVDAEALPDEIVLGFPVVKSMGHVSPLSGFISGAGDNKVRQDHHAMLCDLNVAPCSLIDPTAVVAAGANIGAGSFVGANAYVGPEAIIGAGVIINTGAIVEHEVSIGDFTHISVNTTVAGRSRVGQRDFIGASATIIDRVTVGDDITVGAGSVVVEDLPYPGTYVGAPARPISSTIH